MTTIVTGWRYAASKFLDSQFSILDASHPSRNEGVGGS
jgi:hypothetical protein